MKRYLIAIVTVFVLICSVGFAAEASVQTVKYDTENEILTITGSEDSKLKAISVEVLKGGVTDEQFEEADHEARFEMIAHADETTSMEEGKWNFSFGFPADSEKHIIRIRSGKESEVEKYSIFAATNEEFEDAFDKINNAASDNISDRLNECVGVLGLNYDAFEKLPMKNRTAIALRVLNERNEQPGKVFAEVESLEAVFDKNLAIEYVNTSSADNIESVLEKYEVYFNYKNEKAYKIFTDLSADSQKSVYTNLATADYSSPKEVDAAFVVETVRERFAALRGYDELYDILPVCANALGADISTYSGLTEKNKLLACAEILKNLNAKSITKEVLGQTVNSIAKKYKNSGSSQGGGSGSGSGSGGLSTTPSVSFGVSGSPASDTSMFSDIENVSWARESIEELAKTGVINGKGDKKFAPNDFVTREEFVKMVVLAFNVTANDENCSFSDVSDDAWYKEYIAKAAGSGLVNGRGDGTFGVGESITRQDIAVILWNGIKSKAESKSAAEFIDNDDVSDYAKEAVNAMRYLNIIDGYDDNTFRPNNAATRAEAAKLLYKAVQITE